MYRTDRRWLHSSVEKKSFKSFKRRSIQLYECSSSGLGCISHCHTFDIQFPLRRWWWRSCQVQSFSVRAYRRTYDLSLAVQHIRRYNPALLLRLPLLFQSRLQQYTVVVLAEDLTRMSIWAAHSRAKWSGTSFRISAFTYGRCLRHTCKERRCSNVNDYCC